MGVIQRFALDQPKYHYNYKHSPKVTEFLAVPPSMSHLHRFYLSPVFKRMIHNMTNMLQKKKSGCMSPLWFSRGSTLPLAVLVPDSTL